MNYWNTEDTNTDTISLAVKPLLYKHLFKTALYYPLSAVSRVSA